MNDQIIRKAILSCLATSRMSETVTSVWHYAKGFARPHIPNLGRRAVATQIERLLSQGVLSRDSEGVVSIA